jgi:hypothetical protein
MTLEGLRGFPQGVVLAVDALTRREGAMTEEFVTYQGCAKCGGQFEDGEGVASVTLGNDPERLLHYQCFREVLSLMYEDD